MPATPDPDLDTRADDDIAAILSIRDELPDVYADIVRLAESIIASRSSPLAPPCSTPS